MTSTRFIFIDKISSEAYTTLLVDEVIHPIERLNLEEISAKNEVNTEIIAVLGNHFTSEHYLQLPNLQYAQSTVPYALEDRLVSNIESLHFSYNSKAQYQGYFFIVVTEKAFMDELLAHFEDHDLKPSSIICNQLFTPNHCYLLKEGALFNHLKGCGFLNLQASKLFVSQNTDELTAHSYLESNPNLIKHIKQLPGIESHEHDESYTTYFVKNFDKTTTINLLQGPYESSHAKYREKRLTKLSIFAFAFAFVFFLFSQGMQYYLLSKQQQQLKQQIASLYYQFFPQAGVVVSPKFRVEQLLKQTQSGTGDSKLLLILAKIAPQIEKIDTIKINNLNFNGQNLNIELLTETFDSLNTLQQNLEKQGLNINQTQAQPKEKEIVVNWEVTYE